MAKRLFPLAAIALTVAILGASPAISNDPVVAEVTKANDVVQLATLHYDRKTMDAMITNDFVLVLTNGAIENRAAWLADVADRTGNMEVNQVESLQIHHYNDDCALAIGVLHIRAHPKDKLYDVRMRFIDVWVKQNGQWKWASSQVSHFPKA